MPKSKYYKKLGLPIGASEAEIKKRYRKLVMLYHPDRNDASDAERKFLELQEAYEILLDKKPMPQQRVRRSTSASNRNASNGTKTEEELLKEKEQRVKEARQRQRDHAYREHIENERYYQQLTGGVKWKTIRLSALVGLILSCFLIMDKVLPHHYSEDRVTGYSLNRALGTNGLYVSLIETESGNQYWIERITHRLYGKNPEIFVESSWIFHNPIRLVSRGKLDYLYFDVHFNFYRFTYILIPFFLLPAFTLWYKRRKISFTVLFHFCYYGVNGLMLLYLFTGDRWIHLLTLGFL